VPAGAAAGADVFKTLLAFALLLTTLVLSAQARPAGAAISSVVISAKDSRVFCQRGWVK
jgi:hypothetical protein